MPTINPANFHNPQHAYGTSSQKPPAQGDTFAGRTVSTPPNGTRLPVPPDPRRDLKPRVLTQDAPAWKPQGTYTPAQKKEIMPQMRDYASFLCKHPEQIPQDVRGGVEADLTAGKTMFFSLMLRLREKHFPNVPQAQAPQAQASGKTQESAQTKSDAPAFVPHGEYTQAEHKQLLPQMHAYAKFLSENPSQVPPDIKRALWGSMTPRADTVRILMVKHFPHTRALLLKVAPPYMGDAMAQMVLQNALQGGAYKPIPKPRTNLPQASHASQASHAPQTPYTPIPKPRMNLPQASHAPQTPLMNPPEVPHTETPDIPETPPEESLKSARFGINLAPTTKAEKGAWSAAWTPDAQEPGTKFYHEKQAMSSGLCGMHSINAFAGAPVVSPGNFQQTIFTQLMKEGFVDAETAREIAKDGSDPGALATMVKGLSERGVIDPAAQHTRAESMNFKNETLRQEFCAKINTFPGDRVIVGYGGGHEGESHFVALRRDTQNNWVLLNSLEHKQEPIEDLGAYVVQGRAHAHFIQMEKGFTVETTPPEPEKPAGQGVA